MAALTTVLGKVAVMLLLIALGVFLSRRGALTERGASEITSLLIKVVTPCLIIHSLISSEGDLSPLDLLLCVGVSSLSFLLAIGLAFLSFRREPDERRKVLRFAAIFSNAGFMGLPLVQGIVGGQGVVFGSLFVVTFNLFCWTLGYGMMSGGKMDLKSALLNPGVLGLAVGLPLFFLKLPLPLFLTEAVGSLAQLNTPLAMLVIGSYVAKVDLRAALGDRRVYWMCFLRLIAAPALYFGALLLLRPQRDLFLSTLIQASAPVAANCVLFSVEYGGDADLAAQCVAVSTVLSVLSIPAFALLGQWACGGLG